ncbi:polysaccharide deacetylase family protein [Yinghuangia soli]|uniref:Polysaccharide deacetylase family protein n=1 Tax=Yinghuangia soli TaxID=2908204 RepID=A0AA41QC15_9ACTN|nr:polysaccharide deacetylase family protein [Yinghuangia soli]MCF2534012.1 polysaccharide deacetylase family protein [Yinghuangia soli]
MPGRHAAPKRPGPKRRLIAVLAFAGLAAAVPAPAHAAPQTPETPEAAVGQCSAGYAGISFDDGPTPLTSAYVQALADAGWTRATFFLTGAHALDMPDAVRELAAYGHWIGNHSYSHPFLDEAGEPGAFDELLGTNQIIESMTGSAPVLFRPPFGRTTPQIREDARVLGMTEALWTVDSFDYTGIGTDEIVANALTVEPGGVILLHDGYETTLAAIPRIVQGLADRGLCAGKIVPSEAPVQAWPGMTYDAVAAHW